MFQAVLNLFRNNVFSILPIQENWSLTTLHINPLSCSSLFLWNWHLKKGGRASLEISRREPGAICISKLRLVHRDLAWTRGNSKRTRGNFAKYSSMLPEHKKVRTQRGRFSLVFIIKTINITPKGKFTANIRISVVYYISLWRIATDALRQQIVTPGCWFFIVHGCNG